MRIGAYELESPLINAGGLVKTVEDTARMARTPVGAVLGGSFTLDEKIGNSPNGEVVYYYDPVTRTTYNSLGMPNKGIRTLARSGELQRMINICHDLGKPFILNFAPISDDPVEEVIDMSEELANARIENLDAVELNASCPNVVIAGGGRHEILSHHPELMGEVLLELSDISANEVPFSTLIVRISPFRNRFDATNTAAVAKESGIQAISAFNTFPNGVPTNAKGDFILQVPYGVGGQSGPAMSSEAERQTRLLLGAREAAQASFEVIGSNGIGSAEAMKRRLDLGCSAVSATTLFWEARDWGEAASRLLADYAEL